MKKLADLLAGIPMTIAGGICLLLSFVLPHVGIVLPIDPAWITILISGIPLLYLAVWRIIHNPGIRKISSALLITIAMLAAIAIGDWFAAGEVAWIMAIGAILEDLTTNRAKQGLTKLIRLAPTQGRRIREGAEELVSPEEIQTGDLLRILPGETIPVDGVIVQGETSVDQSIMTGESLPVDKHTGDAVFCGTVNRFGSMDIQATKVGQDSSLQTLIRMVQEAEKKQAPMQRIADRCASWLVPVALLIAIVTGFVQRDLIPAVTVLVVFCPCALVLATPTAIMAAIGQATKHGVIIKSGEALETMGHVDTIALDKTGTLTYGRLEVSDILPLQEGLDEGELLSLAASAESRSEHPLGAAIVSHARAQAVPILESTDFQMTAGRGIQAQVAGRRLLCGNEAFLAEHGIATEPATQTALEQLQAQGKASVLVAEGTRCLGILALSDVLRPEAKTIIQQLTAMHIKTILLTGDSHTTARYFANRVGISEVQAQLLPEEKVAYITQLQAAGRTVCMIGDGVNDAPALKTANAGVAMGSMGSDIAVEAADVALMQDDLSQVPYLKRLSNATVHTIRFSICLSMLINLVAVTLSVLGLLNPTTGALVHNAGSCLVVLIAALLYDRKFNL